jgi:hypothetical protein
MLHGFEHELVNSIVILDCTDLRVSTPSFVDELVLAVLVEFGARELRIQHAPEQTRMYALRSAELRSVSDRLRTA